MSCAPGGGYQVRTGTSMATPFVTGSAKTFDAVGIVNGNDAYLYGEKNESLPDPWARKLPGFYSLPESGVRLGSTVYGK